MKVEGYAIKFGRQSNGDMIYKSASTIKYFENLKISGEIVDFEVDKQGVKIIKEIKLLSVSIVPPFNNGVNVT